jgi:NDP-sugar pyrophosphorylase family protein
MNLAAMIGQHKRQQPLATLAVSDRETSRYFLFNSSHILSGWRNVKTGEEKIVRTENPLTQKAFSGIHVINPAIFSLIQQAGKFSMVDVYLGLANHHIITAFDHTGAALVDVGKPESIFKAEAIFS